MLAIPDCTPEQFQKYLLWLHSDEDQAAQKHETIRGGLARFFAQKDYHDPDHLVDVTLGRVIAKIEIVELDENVTQARFIRGYAQNVYLEAHRQIKEEQLDPILDQNKFTQPTPPDDSEKENDLSCLDQCFNQMKPEDCTLLKKYFSVNRDQRDSHRLRLAVELGITSENLRVRVMRRSAKLRTCLVGCKKKKNY